MRRKGKRRGYYRSVKFGVDRKELIEMFGDKRAAKYVKFLKEICYKTNSRYDVLETTPDAIALRVFQMDFYNELTNKYEDLFMYDVILRKYNTQIVDGFAINMTFIGFYDSDIEDAQRAIVTEDIFNVEYEEPYNILEDPNFFVQESLKKSEIIGTLGEFRNLAIPAEYDCCVKMGFAKEEDAEVMNCEFDYTAVRLIIQDLTVTVCENGLMMFPVPVKDDDGNDKISHVTFMCKPYEMTKEELVQALAQLFQQASNSQN